MKGWRARTFYLTRDTRFIRNAAAAIIGVCFVIAYASSKAPKHEVPVEALDDDEALLAHEEKIWREQAGETYLLLNETANTPDAVAEWLRDVASRRDDAAGAWVFDPAQLRLAEFDLNMLLDKHVDDLGSRDAFGDYARALLIKEKEGRGHAVERLREAAALVKSPRYANEFFGDVVVKNSDTAVALAAYIKEGAWPNARRARNNAWSLAAACNDKAALEMMLLDGKFRHDATAHQLVVAAHLSGDFALMARAFVVMELREWLHWQALLALFAASIWYVIMVYGGATGRWLWLWFLLPLSAGIVSTWLVDLGFQFFEYGHVNDDEISVPQSILHLVFYVGLTEETAKLLFFTPFLFWLLKRGVRSDAALTAGCVGLGFAASENISYFMREGATVALGRMVTANFFHMALTGLLGVALYDWLRARCHRAEVFLLVYAVVVVAHGMYDFACGEQANAMGVDFMQIIIFVLSARYYFHVWQPELRHRPRQVVSSVSVFCFGCALFIGVVMIVAGRTGDRHDIYAALGLAVSLAPVAWIFVREFHGA